MAKNANSLQVVLLKTIKKGEEWLTNYGKDYWLISRHYNSLDTKTKKLCRDFYKISVAELIDDDISDKEDQDDDQEDEVGDSDSGSSGSEKDF